MHRLIKDVVNQDICIGCGICAGVCPKNNIKMVWDDSGELIPCIVECCGVDVCDRLCIAVCPILNPGAAKSASKSSHKSIEELLIGKSEVAYLGFVNDGAQRNKSSSGGLLTWLLIELLEKKFIDGVITTVTSATPENGLFKFDILRGAEELRAASGSKYYPVEAGEVIKRVMKDKTDDVYAIIGVPCLLQGINIARGKYKKLERKIRYSFSLTCGQLPNAAYTELLASCSGVPGENLKSVDYRNKINTTSASNFTFVAEDRQGNKGKALYWVEQPSYLWENSFFIHSACRFCDDLYGRTADAVFMDAWLPGISEKPEGHSLVVIRNTGIDRVFRSGAEIGVCTLETVGMNIVLNSQSTQIIKKTEILSAHLYKAQKEGMRITERSVEADSGAYKKWRKDIELQWQTKNESKSIWRELKKTGRQGEFFNHAKPIMKRITFRKRVIYLKQAMQKLAKNPWATFRRVISHQLNRIIK